MIEHSSIDHQSQRKGYDPSANNRHGAKGASLLAPLLALVLMLSACGQDQPPTVKAPSPTPSVEISATVTAEAQDATQPEEEVKPAAPTISITTPEGEETPPEETIASIIAQLQLTKPDRPGNDDTQAISKALTSANLVPSVPAAPPPNNVIWTLDTDADETVVQESADPVIPEGQDPSLAADAWAAAFAMIRQSKKLDEQVILPETNELTVVEKAETTLRVAVLIPLSGPAAKIGQDIRRGAELAIFTLDNPNIDLTFHDTSEHVESAVSAAITQGADLVIGPLFADHARRAQPLAAMAGIPMLTFSNDSTVAGDGVWLIGQTPEQDIDIVLRTALSQIKPIDADARSMPNLIIIAQDNDYGSRVSQYAIKVLRETNVATADLLTLNDEVLNDEKSLRQSIKNLTGWLPPSSEGDVKPPKYDMVLMAGHEAFSLRVAPVLSWYDLDPEKVQYLGPSTWNNAAILQEPSLENAWFADAPQRNQDRFQQIWRNHFNDAASRPALLAFDAIAMASTLNHDSPALLKQSLINDKGFSGFSGLFRLNADGSNHRLLEIRQITNNAADVLVPAGQQF